MTTDELTELNILLSLVIGRWIPPKGSYDTDAISSRADELLNKFLQPYKVNEVNEHATKVD